MMLAIVAEYETWQDAQRRLEPWVRGSQRVGTRNDEPESDADESRGHGPLHERRSRFGPREQFCCDATASRFLHGAISEQGNDNASCHEPSPNKVIHLLFLRRR